jgi:D-glycero-D-manno-heptose 1,7-bisphosphate phosphatase
MVTAAVFLDRDGVINANVEREGKPVAPTRLEHFHILPGVRNAVSRLKSAGYLVIVCTNQPDVATGRTPRMVVDQMHQLIREQIAVDDIKVCFHTDADACACRKPKPGMIFAAAREFSIDLGLSYMVGDRWRDIAAGRAAGCLTVFIDYGYEQEGLNEPHHVSASLTEAVDIILRRARDRSHQSCPDARLTNQNSPAG